MKLFMISQQQNNDYDTYDSAVVAAPDEETARHMHPDHDWGEAARYKSTIPSWCSGPEHVHVQYLGEASDVICQGVICASFNAG